MMSSNQAGGNRVAVNSAHKFEDQKKIPSPPAVESDTSTKGSSYRNTDSTVRVCSDCNTTKTPLWRSGPRGPKSLCNACGIRQRKARRALAAAAAAVANGTINPPATPSIKIKVKSKTKRQKNDSSNGPQFKKGCKNKLPRNSSPTKKINNFCYEDFTSRILSKHYSAYQGVFPQDEREAAILLMALSYGLVHG
ncbi:hypothetical protein CDL15_Pgr011845 [Punica granatum]|uniref:GATA-type domain-containing protein n=1 Tax=Punica granatum TaxID=22663 RepID=A0A218XDZ3_PUNGR|nr:hypothetical protein CDL15_Pgr011845 [Punica granatum]